MSQNNEQTACDIIGKVILNEAIRESFKEAILRLAEDDDAKE